MELSEEVLKQLVEYLYDYNYLYDSPNIQFFTKEIWRKIPIEWLKYLSQLDNEELNSLPFEQVKESCPENLKNFIKRSKHVSVLNRIRFFEEVEECDHLISTPNNIKAIKYKKSHELDRLLKLIKYHSKLYNITRIVDIGCGLGHLLNRLQDEFEVLGIESNEVLCQKSRSYYDSIRIEKIRLDQDSLRNESVMDILCGPSGSRTCVVCLHGCGDLQPFIFRFFDELFDERVILLLTVSCCYHKVSTSDKPVAQWLLSDTMRSLVRQDWILSVSALRLACQEQLSRWSKSLEIRNRHKMKFIQRTLLECLFSEIGFNTCGFPRQLKRSFKDVESMAVVLAERLNIVEDEKEKLNHLYHQIYRKYEYLFGYIEPFTFLQSMMQLPLESFVLCDRYLFMIEKGFTATLYRVFDSQISPRNFCMVVLREISKSADSKKN